MREAQWLSAGLGCCLPAFLCVGGLTRGDLCLHLLFWPPVHAPSCAQEAPESAAGEQAAPAADAAPQGVQPDPEIVAALTAMGFSENGSKRAAVATQVPARAQQIFASPWVHAGSGVLADTDSASEGVLQGKLLN